METPVNEKMGPSERWKDTLKKVKHLLDKGNGNMGTTINENSIPGNEPRRGRYWERLNAANFKVNKISSEYSKPVKTSGTQTVEYDIFYQSPTIIKPATVNNQAANLDIQSTAAPVKTNFNKWRKYLVKISAKLFLKYLKSRNTLSRGQLKKCIRMYLCKHLLSKQSQSENIYEFIKSFKEKMQNEDSSEGDYITSEEESLSSETEFRKPNENLFGKPFVANNVSYICKRFFGFLDKDCQDERPKEIVKQEEHSDCKLKQCQCVKEECTCYKRNEKEFVQMHELNHETEEEESESEGSETTYSSKEDGISDTEDSMEIKKYKQDIDWLTNYLMGQFKKVKRQIDLRREEDMYECIMELSSEDTDELRRSEGRTEEEKSEVLSECTSNSSSDENEEYSTSEDNW